MDFNFFKIEKDNEILKVYFNNDKSLNALTMDFFSELPEVVKLAEEDSEISVVIFSSNTKHFSVGLDVFSFGVALKDIINMETKEKRKKLYKLIKEMQSGMTLMEEGSKIYIASINGYCIGGALDFIAACDLRFASKDAIFSLREAKIGITADLGSLQRLPFIIGIANTKYLAYTGMDIDVNKAKEMGLVNDVFETKEELDERVLNIAKDIAENPKDAVSNSKKFINNLHKQIVEKELDIIAIHNSSALDFNEINEYFQKSLNKGRKNG
ncbi:enoyl-CoA hydratase [Thermotomaculum hydrothermale]|uniref:Enoyl-CoA hydratase n=1 Tax=Thermotomaculum hydrothermale TaxID=981385 RepID=A0A7R6PEU1_9BACT|nr:enoyl-CoA hydratase-related protein [Thermotomaculum hydrothermale]BBB32404.1 enoyl-CoA hydratase [Thermotomaculum hydrothermale]